MVSPGQIIAYEDLKALADLANSKLALSTPLAFTAFAGTDKIALAANFKATPNYGMGNFGPGGKVTAWLYSYKTIDGVKTYSYDRAEIAMYAQNNGQSYLIDYTWQNVVDSTAPDGYVIVFPQGDRNGIAFGLSGAWSYYWRDIGNVSSFAVSDASFIGWNNDLSLVPAANFNVPNPGVDVPCAHGTWLKTLNRIFNKTFFQSDVACSNYGDVTGMGAEDGESGDGITIPALGIGALVSGPWCVSAGTSPLQCWFQKFHRFLPNGVTDQFVPDNAKQFTQVYRNIKFYYNSGDAPGGVNLTAVNQLLNYEIASVAGTFLLQLLSCSTGHIKITYTVGGATIADQDVEAGAVYDFSFANAAALLAIDIVFTTAAPGAPAAAVGISGDSILSVSVPDSYFEILANTPIVEDVNPNIVAFTIQTTSCGQLTLTEQNGTPGVWVANTLPTRGIMPFVDQDLPNYSPSGGFPASSRRVAKNEALAATDYQPLIDNLPANWPCYPSQDFLPDNVAGQPFLGSPAWRATIGRGTPYVETFSEQNEIPVYDGSNLWIDANIFVQPGTVDIRAVALATGAVLYIAPDNPPTLSSYAATAPAGTWISMKDVNPAFETGTNWYFAIYNPTTGVLENTTCIVLLTGDEAPNGTFFSTQGPDDSGQVGPTLEGFSYLFNNPDLFHDIQRPIPLFGYCIYSITICRLPGADMSQDVTVDVGTSNGFGWGAQGDMEILETFTIPAGQPSITQAIFWPVLQGTPLRYDFTDDVIITAQANFQPLIHSNFAQQTVNFSFGGSSSPVVMGYYDGAPFFQPFDSDVEYMPLLFFPDEGFIGALGTVLPIASAIYNDLTALLNLFP